MVVIGIVGVFAAVAVVSLPRISSDMRVSKASHVFAGMVREARGRALADRAFVRIQVETGPKRFRLQKNVCPFEVTDSTDASCDGWSIIEAVQLEDGSEFRGVDFDSSTTTAIEFSPRGLLVGGAGVVVFKSSSHPNAPKRTVIVNSGGNAERSM